MTRLEQPAFKHPVAPEPQVTMRAKVVTWLINRILHVTNKKINIAQLQKNYHATEGLVIEMHIVDVDRRWLFRTWQGKLELLNPPQKVAGGIQTNADALIALALGSRKKMDPATGVLFSEPYTPFDALTHGDVKIWGEAATNDALLFSRAIHEKVYPQIRAELQAAQTAV